MCHAKPRSHHIPASPLHFSALAAPKDSTFSTWATPIDPFFKHIQFPPPPHFSALAAPKDSTFSTWATPKDPFFKHIQFFVPLFRLEQIEKTLVLTQNYISLLFLAPKSPVFPVSGHSESPPLSVRGCSLSPPIFKPCVFEYLRPPPPGCRNKLFCSLSQKKTLFLGKTVMNRSKNMFVCFFFLKNGRNILGTGQNGGSVGVNSKPTIF